MSNEWKPIETAKEGANGSIVLYGKIHGGGLIVTSNNVNWERALKWATH